MNIDREGADGFKAGRATAAPEKAARPRRKRIQSFAALIAFTGDWRIVHASENAANMLGQEGSVLGRPVTELFPEDTMHAIRSHLMVIGNTPATVRIADAEVGSEGRKLNLGLHVTGELNLLELEQTTGPAKADVLSVVLGLMDRIATFENTTAMLECAAFSMKVLSGFDRVKIYQAGEKGSGKIVAEVRNGGATPNLGVSFREADLLVGDEPSLGRTPARVIPDTGGSLVEIKSEPWSRAPALDLSLAASRSGVATDLSYLRMDGVRAFMTVPIQHGGQTWGRFVCHHETPREIGFATRSAVELFTEMFAQELSDRTERDRRRLTDLVDALRKDLFARSEPPDPIADFDWLHRVMAELIDFDGIAVFRGGKFKSAGAALSADEFDIVRTHLAKQARPELFATDRLHEVIPDSHSISGHISGLMIIQTSYFDGGGIALFRREVTHTINWGGRRPEGDSEEAAGAGQKMFLRRELVLGHSTAWRRSEVRAAEEVRSAFLEADLRHAARIQSAYAARHERLLTTLGAQGHALLDAVGRLSASEPGSDASAGAAERRLRDGVAALERALVVLAACDWGPVSLGKAVRAQLQTFADAHGFVLRFEGEDVMVTAAAVISVAEEVQAILGEFEDLAERPDAPGEILVAASILDVEAGGRELGPVDISRRRLVRFSLSTEAGRIRVGVMVPKTQIVSEAEGFAGHTRLAEPHPQGGTKRPKSVLLVEDDTPVALKTAEQLKAAGVGRVEIATNVGEALRVLDRFRPDVALLDINMGSETSRPVAQRLAAMDVPVLLATGYTIDENMLGSFYHVDRLLKPFTTEDLLFGLSRATMGRGGS